MKIFDKTTMPKSFFHGSIRAINTPSNISGKYRLKVEVSNLSEELWSSETNKPINVSYHC